MTQTKPDPDASKGAVEGASPRDKNEVSLNGQIPHRHNPEADGADSDLPEPGAREEHSGTSSTGTPRTGR